MKLGRFVACALAVLLLLPPSTTAASLRPVAAEDLYHLAFVSAPQISPDGSHVVFVVSRANGPKDRYDTNLFMVDVRGGPVRQLTHTGRDQNPVWSPSGSSIAFLRVGAKKGQSPQIYSYAFADGAVRRLTHLQNGAFGPVYSHDGKHIAFSATTIVPARAAMVDFTAAGFKPSKSQRKSDVNIIRQMHFQVNGGGYTFNHFTHIRVMNADGTGQRALTSGTRWSEGNPLWSPDDRMIAFNSLRYDSPSGAPNDVYTIPAAGGVMRRVASSVPANYLAAYDHHSRIWYFSSTIGDPAAFPALRRVSPRSTATTVVPPNTVQFGDTVLADMGEPGGVCGPYFSTDDRFAITDVDAPGYSALVKLNPASGAVTRLTGSGEASECTLDRAGRMIAYTASDFTHPREVFVLNLQTGRSRKLTAFNDRFLSRVALSKPQEFSVMDDQGFRVQAWFMPALRGTGRRPTLLDIHGGPQTQFGATFFHELQYWAGQGYNVVFSDPRGSVGHGYAFEAALNRRWGEAMFDDVQRVMNAATTRASVDVSRLGVSGGSYGGYATTWIIGHTNRYRVAIAERSVTNLVSEQLAADLASNDAFGSFSRYGFGNPWDPKSANAAESPLTYVENVRTPVMLLHSSEDIRTPVDQTLQEFNALKILGRTAVYVDIPGENHDLSRTGSPFHRVERLRVERQWLQSYLRP